MIFNMAIAAAVILPLGLLFLLSGLIVNAIQALIFITIRPFAKNVFRRMNKQVTELLWLELVWLFDWLNCLHFTIQETYDLLGKEHALLICNHRSDIDWLVGWILAQRFGCLGNTLALIKKAATYLPVIGWSMWFNSYIFLERSWTKDEHTLKSGFQGLNDFPQPFWLVLFVEGTRFTKTKLAAAQEYASSQGLPVPRNVLIPRTKGFVYAVTQLRPFVPVIYDVTVAIPKNELQPTLLRMFRGRSSLVHVRIERHLMDELPETSSGISQWCKDTFVSKDALLERHRVKDTFGSKERHDIGRPVRSLLVVICWSAFLMFGAVKFFERCPFSWGEVAFLTVFLVLVLVLMQILVVFSQSEQPSAIREPPRNSLEERFIPISVS